MFHNIWNKSKTVKKKSPSISVAPGVFLSRFFLPIASIVNSVEKEIKAKEKAEEQRALQAERRVEQERATVSRAEERRRFTYRF